MGEWPQIAPIRAGTRQVSTFDIQAEPPAPEAIRAMRLRAEGADGGKGAALAPPLPMVDLGVGALVGGVYHVLQGADRARLADAPGAAERDWSGSPSARAYVDKVRAQGRALVRGEVEALDAHARTGRFRSGLAAAFSYLRPARVRSPAAPSARIHP